MKKICFYSFILGMSLLLVACEPGVTYKDTNNELLNNSNSIDQLDSDSDEPYTEEDLESDSNAPSVNPNDYNENGEFVPEDGPTSNPEDYNSNGEYKPAEDMSQEEIEAELESMFGN